MNIIIVFPKMEQAKTVRSILRKGGYTVEAVCCTGAQALQAASHLDSGILICAYRLPDMMYSELYEYLKPQYEFLLVGTKSQIDDRELADIVGLSVPFKVHELLETLEMMAATYAYKKKKQKQSPRVRTGKEKRMIGEAKAVLMERNHLSEEEAHRYLQKRSMENGTGLSETAQMILSLLGENR